MRHVDDPNVHVFRGGGQKSEMLRQQMFFTDMRKSLIISSPIPRVTTVNKQSAVTVTALCFFYIQESHVCTGATQWRL